MASRRKQNTEVSTNTEEQNMSGTEQNTENTEAPEGGSMTLTIQGQSFTIRAPYKPGPVELSPGEAHALNQTRAENIRNNFAGMMKARAEEIAEFNEKNPNADPDEAPKALGQADLEAYDAEYQFGIRGGGTRVSRDPVAAEEQKLAKAAVNTWIKAQGKKIKDYSEDAYDALVERVVASGKFRNKAQEIVRVRQQDAESLDTLGLGEVPQAA